MKPSHTSRRRGSAYLMVLGTTLIVAVVALSTLTVARVQRRSLAATGDSTDARYYAEAAIEIALLRIEKNPNWRNTYSNGIWEQDKIIGTGKYTIEGRDPNDGDLDDSDTEAVVLTGIGIQGNARHKIQVTLGEIQQPLDALKTCLHANDRLRIRDGKLLRADGAPISTNDELEVSGILIGNGECDDRDGGGIVLGTIKQNMPQKPLPQSEVFNTYRSLATAIPYSGTIEKKLLTPLLNTVGGGVNANGVYYINAGSNDLTIRASRIHGTLVVKCNRLILDDAVFLQPYRPDYPVLIVDGDVELNYESSNYNLSELSWNTNFNPAGASYNGSADGDKFDSYPNEIQGLVHIKKKLTLDESARVRGVILCEDEVECDGLNQLIHNAALFQNPPIGYTQTFMKVLPDSWRQIVD